jgi:hypothetical protein
MTRNFHAGKSVHSGADKFGKRKSTHEIDEGIFGDELTDVEDGACPGVLRAGQTKIILQSEYSGIAQTLFVKVL